MLHAVIMAGGSGTRFWPLSRLARPKQLLDLMGGRTMIQATVDRLAGLVPADRTWIITNRSLVEPIAAQLPHVPPAQIVGEPCKRDTAPAIGLAALLLVRQDPHAIMAVMPADHRIEPSAALQRSLQSAAAIVEQNPETLVTFGIAPGYPAESFGYIERGPAIAVDDASRTAAFDVIRFREKPARSIAEEYVASGRFYWNSGIFIWRAATILAALAQYEPEMMAHLQRIEAAFGQDDFAVRLDREFTAIRGKSIDFAVMERYRPVVVIEAPFQWDDVGSWQSLGRSLGADADGNTIVGRHVGIRTRGAIVRTSDEHLVVTLGVNDVVIVHTDDATLVAAKDQEESIRDVVKAIEERGWQKHL